MRTHPAAKTCIGTLPTLPLDHRSCGLPRSFRMKNSAHAVLNRYGSLSPERIPDTERQATELRTALQERAQVRTMRVQRWEDVPDLEGAWTSLLNLSHRHSVFQTYAWNRCWWNAFRGSHELFVILAYAGSRLIGIAPMMICTHEGVLGRVRRHVRFLGSSNNASDYCDFITDPDVPQALEALLDEMSVQSGGFQRMDLSNFPSHSPNRNAILEYFEKRKARFAVEFQADAPVRILGDTQADLKAANKSSLKRHTKFFEKSGELRFHQCRGEDEILGYLDIFFEQHKSRRAQTGSPSQFFDPAQQVFYRELVQNSFRLGWLRFDVVLFNGAPLAFHFGFEYQHRFIWYKPTFDVQFASKSPGEVLIKFLLDDAIRKGLEEFDFTVGSESFKYRFANRIRSNERLIAFSSAGDYWIHRGVRRGKAMLKQLLGRKEAPRDGAESTR
jgi:CelD/BcsL family acetyltransferase involved in cellulose biosynthesis